MEPPVRYLMECSKNSLRSFRLNRLNRRAEAQKALRRLLLEAIQAEAEALLADWIEQRGEEFFACLEGPAGKVDLHNIQT